jgi:hypothetical protein
MAQVAPSISAYTTFYSSTSLTTLTIPSSVKVGDTMVIALFTTNPSGINGWGEPNALYTVFNGNNVSQYQTIVFFTKTATASDIGSTVTVGYGYQGAIFISVTNTSGIQLESGTVEATVAAGSSSASTPSSNSGFAANTLVMYWGALACNSASTGTVGIPSDTTSSGTPLSFANTLGATQSLALTSSYKTLSSFQSGISADTYTINAPVAGNSASFLIPFSAVNAPAAPTALGPGNNAYIDYTQLNNFVWQYNPTTGDGAQNAYSLKRTTGSTTTYWNASNSSWGSAVVWNSSTNNYVAFPANSWGANGTTYQWAVATQEGNYGLQGPYSSSNTVTGQVAPVCVVNTPSGTENATTTPTISWTDTLASGCSQTQYQVVIESGSYGTGPGVGTTVVSTGTPSSAATSYTVSGIALRNNTTYRAFVQITQTGNQTSAWAYTTFTVAVNPPSPPSITTTPLTSAPGVYGFSQSYVQITTSDTTANSEQFDLQKSTDGGVTWNSLGTSVQIQQFGSFYDYLAPTGIPVLYQAMAVINYGTTNQLQSPWSNSSSITLPGTGTSQVTDSQTINSSVPVIIQLGDFVPSSVEQQAVFYTLGNSTPVILSDTVSADTVDITFTFPTIASYNAFRKLQQAKKVITLTLGGVTYYMRLGANWSFPFLTPNVRQAVGMAYLIPPSVTA